RTLLTSIAGPSARVGAADPDLKALLARYPYLTRVYTRISPEDMTIDPVFKFDSTLPEISNIHDLSNDPNRVWDCSNMTNTVMSPAQAVVTRATDSFNPVVIAIYVAGLCVALALGFVG